MRFICLFMFLVFIVAEVSAVCKDCVKLTGVPGEDQTLVAMQKDVDVVVSRTIASSDIDKEVIKGLCYTARDFSDPGEEDKSISIFDEELQLVAEERRKKVQEAWKDVYPEVTCINGPGSGLPLKASLLGIIAWLGHEEIVKVIGKYTLDLNLKHRFKADDPGETIMEWINRTLTSEAKITEDTKANLIKIGKIFNSRDALPALVKCDNAGDADKKIVCSGN